MIGIDTNILVRLLVRDHDAQVRAAEKFVTTHCTTTNPGFVSRVVIAELAWVLDDYYGYDRHEIAAALHGLRNVTQLKLDAAEAVEAALTDFVATSAEFADCLIARLNRSAGCEYTVTFDRKAGKLAGFRPLAT
jgi:predicted nucleic-acid-binding protein